VLGLRPRRAVCSRGGRSRTGSPTAPACPPVVTFARVRRRRLLLGQVTAWESRAGSACGEVPRVGDESDIEYTLEARDRDAGAGPRPRPTRSGGESCGRLGRFSHAAATRARTGSGSAIAGRIRSPPAARLRGAGGGGRRRRGRPRWWRAAFQASIALRRRRRDGGGAPSKTRRGRLETRATLRLETAVPTCSCTCRTGGGSGCPGPTGGGAPPLRRATGPTRCSG